MEQHNLTINDLVPDTGRALERGHRRFEFRLAGRQSMPMTRSPVIAEKSRSWVTRASALIAIALAA